MVKLAKLTKGPNYNGWFRINRWLGCVGHRLHLVVTEALKVSGIRISTTKVGDFATKYTRNGQMRKQMGNLAQKKKINAPSNRWFYSIFKIKRILELKEEVRIVG